MIAWSIQAALDSGCFDDVIISTDDVEIANVAQECGASVPFMRPVELSDDYTGTIPVLRHALETMESLMGYTIQKACCIYATAPFVTPDILKLGREVLLSDNKLDFAFSVASYPFPIQRSLRVTPDNRVEMVYPENEQTRSQDLPERYHDAGQFYWFRPAGLEANDGVFSARSAPVIISRERVQDIDTLEDWNCAELLHRMLEEREAK